MTLTWRQNMKSALPVAVIKHQAFDGACSEWLREWGYNWLDLEWQNACLVQMIWAKDYITMCKRIICCDTEFYTSSAVDICQRSIAFFWFSVACKLFWFSVSALVNLIAVLHDRPTAHNRQTQLVTSWGTQWWMQQLKRQMFPCRSWWVQTNCWCGFVSVKVVNA